MDHVPFFHYGCGAGCGALVDKMGELCPKCGKATRITQCVSEIEAILAIPGAEAELVQMIGESKAYKAICDWKKQPSAIGVGYE